MAAFGIAWGIFWMCLWLFVAFCCFNTKDMDKIGGPLFAFIVATFWTLASIIWYIL